VFKLWRGIVMSLLKVGMIGVGGRARSHIPTLLKLGDKYRLVAICDVDATRLRNAAEETRAAPYLDVMEMLNKEKLDACLIAVQAEGHHIMAKALAERGIHILTETPVAITVACTDQMIETAKEYGVFLEVSENVPRWPHERLKQKIVAADVLGKVREFYLSYVSGSYHGIAAIRSILKTEAESVVGEFPSKDSILERAKILFPKGVRGTYEFNREKRNYWEIVGTMGALRGNELHLFAGDQRLQIQTERVEVGSDLRVTGARVATQPEISFQNLLMEYPLADYDEVAIADAWVGLYEAVINGKPLSYGAENARKDMELLMAIRDSAFRNGTRVRLPMKSVTEHEKLIHSEFAEVYGSDPLDTTLEDLKARYTLPERLRELMYYGRTLQ